MCDGFNKWYFGINIYQLKYLNAGADAAKYKGFGKKINYFYAITVLKDLISKVIFRILN